MAGDEGLAVVFGAAGGIGSALVKALSDPGRHARVIGISRNSTPSVDITNEQDVAGVAEYLAGQGEVRLIIDATGLLHGDGMVPEKSWRGIDPDDMLRSFAVNAVGPALLMKHLLPLFPRRGRAVFATLSAKVGSISDNRLGGWYSYRASKAALNQIVRTAAIELSRSRPDAICVAIHPGTVDTSLSRPFARSGLAVRTAGQAAAELVTCLDGLAIADSGQLLDRTGVRLDW